MTLLKSLGPHNCDANLGSKIIKYPWNFYLTTVTTMFLHPGNFFHKEGTPYFLKDEMPLRDSFNHTSLPKCWCTSTTTHPSPKERDYCTHYWCCQTLNIKVVISEFLITHFHLAYKEVPILAASSAGLASRQTLLCPMHTIETVCI